MPVKLSSRSGNTAPVPDFSPHAHAAALRDFFSASGGESLVCAVQTLATLAPQMNLPSTGAEAGREVEYAFNRVFIGPMSVPAPPYASVYLEKEPVLMGPSALDIRTLLHSLGLQLPKEGQEAEDHAACELEVWRMLSTMFEKDGLADDVRTGLSSALDWLVHEHMALWIPRFIARARAAEALPPALNLALDRFDAWLSHVMQRSSHA